MLIPGPGNYQPSLNNSKVKTPTWKFGTGPRLQGLNNSTNNIPGPGNYNTTKGLGSEAPKYSMTAKHSYRGNKLNVPGPGQYAGDSSVVNSKAPTWKIGTSRRDDSLNRTLKENHPGPGNYNSLNKEKGPLFSFGKDAKIKTEHSSNPGPGQYKIPASIFNVPTFTQGGWDKSLKFI